ncbi:hypothetical protein GLOIN_2v1560574 [Rhizophagus clarus]|uniref:Uncharacterized protein n=1 Tax=Rhizophagus clarus TaxID=94130 RepID=A0A8H3QUG5_9GLOM|nr:hypothetical protein GLOIN_2v1560574 [Rhizophagus clarus]
MSIIFRTINHEGILVLTVLTSHIYTLIYSAKLQVLENSKKKSGPQEISAIFKNNPDIVSLVLLEIDDDNEMPALIFDWNVLGFNDTAVTNCHSGIVNRYNCEHGATNYRNKNIFQDGSAI